MNDLRIIKTDDGSHSMYSDRFESSYHSSHGAIQESKHVFIKNGLEFYFDAYDKKEIEILEYGFGTGLNALLAMQFADVNDLLINYTGIEAYPIGLDEARQLNYIEELGLKELKKSFDLMHAIDDLKVIELSSNFVFKKQKIDFEKFNSKTQYDIVFFDVFGAEVNPHFWLRPFLDNVYRLLNNNGILITYGAKGSFKRALKSLGFKIDNPAGPPGKREITRAIKVK